MPQKFSDKILFTNKGIKITKRRAILFDILKESDTPMSVEEIYSKICGTEDSFNMSTVYRILEVFVSKGLVIKSSKVDNNAAVFELSRDKHLHHFICLKCSKVISIATCPLKNFEESMKRNSDFEITGHKLEFFGYCSDCKKGN